MRFFSTGNRVWCRAGARSSFFALLAGMLVVLLAVLLATPAFAQTPPTPGVSLSRNSNGDLLATVTSSDNSLNKLQVHLRSRAAGASAFNAWFEVADLTNVNFNITVEPTVVQASAFDAGACYQARAQVFHSSADQNRSGWGYAQYGPSCPGGLSGPTVIVDGRLNIFGAAPVVVFPFGAHHLTYYAIMPNSQGEFLGLTANVPALLNSGAAAGALAQWTNPASGKPVIISYDGAGLITVHTFYADSPYYEEKPVIFTIDQLGEVQILAW